MAEFIPMRYRGRLAVRQRLRFWLAGVALVAAFCAAMLLAYGVWAHASAAEVVRLQQVYRQQSAHVRSPAGLQAKRQELADKMKKMEDLRDDNIVLALLRNVSAGFSEYDCLWYVHIEARGGGESKDPAVLAATAAESYNSHYLIHLSGVTLSPTSQGDLMTRMGKQQDPAMQVQLESSKRESYLDGQVIHFILKAEKPGQKGGA